MSVWKRSGGGLRNSASVMGEEVVTTDLHVSTANIPSCFFDSVKNSGRSIVVDVIQTESPNEY